MQNAELEGLRALRTGTLFLIISSLLAGIVVVFFLPALLGAIIVILIVVAVLGIVGVLKLRSGYNILKSLGRDVGIGGTGGTLYLVGLILELVGAILTLIVIGIFVAFIGDILALIGGILLGVGLYKVGDSYNEGTTKIGGILAAIPIGLVSFIGYILAYVGLGKIINMVSSGFSPVNPYGYPQYGYPQQPYQQPYPTQPTYRQPYFSQPQFYQVGQGIIQSNGYAKILLYASAPGVIVSAVMQYPQLTATYVNPTILNPGNNEITIYFSNVGQLQVGNSYTVTLTINAGGNMVTVNAVVLYQG